MTNAIPIPRSRVALKEVESVLDSILNEIGQALRSGQRVDLRGFGSFAVKEKKARQGRNRRLEKLSRSPRGMLSHSNPAKN